MTRSEATERYKALEREITRTTLLEGSRLGRISAMGGKETIHLFAERRGLVSCFTFMCEQFGPTMDTPEARAIIFEIYREELITHNHRVDYYEELETLSIDRDKARKWRFSPTTRQVWAKMMRSIYRYLAQGELERLLLLRYIGEYVPGIEFTEIYNRLHSCGYLDKDTSVFLYPHILFDTTFHKGKASHADRYLELLVDRLQSEGAWRRAEGVLTRAAQTRAHFYSQF